MNGGSVRSDIRRKEAEPLFSSYMHISVGKDMVGKSPYDRQLKEEFQEHRLFGRNLVLQIKVLRINADQFILCWQIYEYEYSS